MDFALWARLWSFTLKASFTSPSKPTDIPDLVEEHLIKGRILERLFIPRTGYG